MLIREIILENWMSYEYARIPLNSGLNIICGPNGSGKSSILLAISVALGQAYTERGRKLSDLIRWGKDTARVTLAFDNKHKEGKRPIPQFDTDHFRLSRYLKKSGDYWFQANFRTITKSEVVNLLNEFGINPDNMLIIMQQHMMEEFGATSPQQKLVMVEDAVGFREYREKVLEAQIKLTQVLSEEESISGLLQNAEQTLAYWKGEYDRYQKRKDLLLKKDFLDHEFAWSQLIRQEKIIESWNEKIRIKSEASSKIEKEISNISVTVSQLKEKFEGFRSERSKLFSSLLVIEKEKTSSEVRINLLNKTLIKIDAYRKILLSVKDQMLTMKTTLNKDLLKMLSEQIDDLKEYVAESLNLINSANQEKAELEKAFSVTQIELNKFEEKFDSFIDHYLGDRVKEALFAFQNKNVESEIDALKKELKEAQKELKQLSPSVENIGVRIETERTPVDITTDIRVTEANLASFSEVSEDVESMYTTYLSLCNELKEKAIIVSENREKALQEVDERKKVWRNLLQTLIESVNPIFQSFLERIGAAGFVRLVNTQDIESAGLDLVVGFKGVKPQILDWHIQSGGERSSATMAFLLALQRHIRSPFRAIDEFDVHMDPRNREVISQMLFKEMEKDCDSQYLSITPGQLTSVGESVHVITVQNVQGRSEIKVVA